MAKYLVRFDDISSRMDWNKFFVLKNFLEKHNIKSILGVVPNCKDPFLSVSQPNKNFYQYLRQCKSYGDSIAQHGYEHKYDSNSKGIFSIYKNSEFAGHPYKVQFSKLLKGKIILEEESLWEPIFMAPAHSFDYETLKALKKNGFKVILDGFSLSPFEFENLKFVPQISSKPLPKLIPCISQLCIHINTISPKEINKLIKFIEKNHEDFISLKELQNKTYSKKIFERMFISTFIKNYRKLRKFKNLIYFLFLKSICIYERIFYRIKLYKVNIDRWHLNGTFHCRQYKILALEIINNLNPKLYIDIGCGLGELLSRVSINSNYKLGFDKDIHIQEAHKRLNKNRFKFFNNRDNMINHILKLELPKKDLKVISMLNFLHKISPEDFKNIINNYYEELGSYILLVDAISNKGKEYTYDHHKFLYNHKGLIRYFFQVDALRSLYCLKVG